MNKHRDFPHSPTCTDPSKEHNKGLRNAVTVIVDAGYDAITVEISCTYCGRAVIAVSPVILITARSDQAPVGTTVEWPEQW